MFCIIEVEANGELKIIHVELQHRKQIYNIIPLQYIRPTSVYLHCSDGDAQQISIGTSFLAILSGQRRG